MAPCDQLTGLTGCEHLMTYEQPSKMVLSLCHELWQCLRQWLFHPLDTGTIITVQWPCGG